MADFGYYHIKFLDNSDKNLNKTDIKELSENTEILKFNRGHFLDYIIEVEIIIDIIIEDYMIHKKSRLKKVFRTNILNNKNTTLHQKMELLCAIIEEKK